MMKFDVSIRRALEYTRTGVKNNSKTKKELFERWDCGPGSGSLFFEGWLSGQIFKFQRNQSPSDQQIPLLDNPKVVSDVTGNHVRQGSNSHRAIIGHSNV